MKDDRMAFNIEAPDLTQERVGNAGVPGVWHFDSGKQGPSVLITALVHGNELCGAWALKELLAHGVVLQNGKLTLMFCNLEAFDTRSEEHTSELQSLMRISYAVFCLKKKIIKKEHTLHTHD